MIFVVLTTMTMTDFSQRLAYGLDTMDTMDDHQDSCEYLDPSSMEDMISNHDLNVVQLNIRGLISKQNRLIKETHSKKPKGEVHVYILNETWVTKANEHMVQIPNYRFIGKHRTNKKGGVLA